MPKLNLQIGLNSYADKVETNQNLLNHFKWLRSVSGFIINNPESSELIVPAGSSISLFNGTVSLSQDNTTKYSISLVSGGMYKLSWSGQGAAPVFRTERVIGLDNTSEVTLTKNGPLMTANFTDGTLPDLSSVVIGDEISLVDRGIFKVLGKTGTSVSWQDESGAEGSFILSSGNDLRIYSAAGVQKGQKLSIKSGFSPASYGDYEITSVAPDFLIFNPVKTIPEESAVLTQIIIYKYDKKMLFIETSSDVTLNINNGDVTKVSPLIGPSVSSPGLLFLTGSIFSAEIVNSGIEEVTIYYISAE